MSGSACRATINRVNCWKPKQMNITVGNSSSFTWQSAAKPQTLLWKVQRLVGESSVTRNTTLAPDTRKSDDIVHATRKLVDATLLQWWPLSARSFPLPDRHLLLHGSRVGTFLPSTLGGS